MPAVVNLKLPPPWAPMLLLNVTGVTAMLTLNRIDFPAPGTNPVRAAPFERPR